MRYIVIDLNLAEDCNRAVKHNTLTNKHLEIMGPAFWFQQNTAINLVLNTN